MCPSPPKELFFSSLKGAEFLLFLPNPFLIRMILGCNQLDSDHCSKMNTDFLNLNEFIHSSSQNISYYLFFKMFQMTSQKGGENIPHFISLYLLTPPPVTTKNKSKSNFKNRDILGFPGGAVVESLPAGAGDTGSSPGLGGSHMPRSNWAREPQLLSLRVWSLCSATREAVIVRGPRTAMKSGPRSPQLEKALAQ